MFSPPDDFQTRGLHVLQLNDWPYAVELPPPVFGSYIVSTFRGMSDASLNQFLDKCAPYRLAYAVVYLFGSRRYCRRRLRGENVPFLSRVRQHAE